MRTPPQLLTLNEFERLPHFDGIQEFLDRVVVEMPPLKRRHSVIVKQIQRILQRHVDDSRI